MEVNPASAWSLNNKEEILATLGEGDDVSVGTLMVDTIPVDSQGRVVIKFPSLQSRLVDVGFFDYNDSQASTINVSANTWTKLTNDGLGAYTNKVYKSVYLTDIWNTSTNQFNWTGMKLGDTVDIRVEFSITTTSPNQIMNMSIYNAVGNAAEYSVGFTPEVQYKNVGTRVVNAFTSIYMGDNRTLLNPSEIRIKSDAPCTVKVSGWYVRTILVGKH